MAQPPSGPVSQQRLRLARLAVSADHPLHQACAHASRISARTLKVRRVGIWLFEQDGALLRRWHLETYPPDGEGPGAGPDVLRASDYPTYVRALDDNRWICADDATSDPATRELARDYLVPLGITSMLDAPIFRSGEVFGVVCHEHVGKARTWSDSDRSFAGSVADILALIFEQAGHLEAERARGDAESRQQQAQKLEVLGRLALGVAHDVGNIFSAVSLLAGRITASADPQAAALGREIQDAITGATSITNGLVAFARQQSSARMRLNLADTIVALAPMLRAVLGSTVALELSAPDAPAYVAAAPGQLQQILLNLVINARDAMKATGAVTVAVQRREGEVVMSVSDSGPGMPAEVRARLFELYRTTRYDDGGSGVGLATVKTIVDNLGGRIDVDSTDRGTTFLVILPEASD